MVKRCKKCGNTKSTEDFNKSSRTLDGLQTQCRTCQINVSKEWRDLNKSRTLEYRKDYYKHNRAVELEYGKNYYRLNQVSRLQYAEEFRKNNPEYPAKYSKKRRAVDVAYRFITNLRVRQKYVLKGKTSTTKGLGCSSEELRDYISSQWTEGMNWENYGWGIGMWVIDHIVPLASYEKDEKGEWSVDSEYNKKLIHYSNMQPMWFIQNAQKSNKKVAGS